MYIYIINSFNDQSCLDTEKSSKIVDRKLKEIQKYRNWKSKIIL